MFRCISFLRRVSLGNVLVPKEGNPLLADVYRGNLHCRPLLGPGNQSNDSSLPFVQVTSFFQRRDV